jgi:DNA polymerase III alpha subunit (gram-positive type)
MSIIYFVDTETTGLNPNIHTVLEVCVVKHVDRKEVDRLSFKIIPSSKDLAAADPQALKINFFDPEVWHREGISQSLACRKISEFVIGSKRSAIVAHNVRFDIAMLKGLFARNNVEHRLPYRCIDTHSVAYAAFEPLGLRSFSLDSIRNFLGWDDTGAHTAEKDVADLIRLWNILSPTPVNECHVSVKEITVIRKISTQSLNLGT